MWIMMQEIDKCTKEVPGGVEISVKVVPGASRDRVAGILGDAIKIQVAAPPEKGKANAAVVRLMAGVLRCPVGQISVVKGLSSPRKTILVRGVGLAQVITAMTDGGK
jgi:uncharacterized protein (TIGR00251 family)